MAGCFFFNDLEIFSAMSKFVETFFILVLILYPHVGGARDLYATEFEDFPVGDNKWANTDGWLSNDTTSGAQGILQDYLPGLPFGKTAFLGFTPPSSTLTTLARSINYDPATEGVHRLSFESYLGVQDSTNGRRDQFFISFYDIDGNFLAAIIFDNREAEGLMVRGQGRADGSIQSYATDVPFIRGDQVFDVVALQILRVEIDLATNTWSAQLDGLPLFSDAPFTDPSFAPLTLGATAAEWELTSPLTLLAGDNWLFVADWFVRTEPQGKEPFLIDTISRNPDGGTTISWTGEPGFDYQVFFSQDLKSWSGNLAGAAFTGVTSTGALTFTDSTPQTTHRFYRVERSVSP